MARKKKNKIVNATFIGEAKIYSEKIKTAKQNGIADIINQAKRYKNNTLQSRTGFVAEADHCATFNYKSAIKESNIKCIREANGNHGDYKIVKEHFSIKNGKIVKNKTILKKGEIKYYKNAEATEQAMRGYGDRQLIGPSDQTEEIRKIATEKAKKNFQKGRANRTKVGMEHKKVAKNVSKSIEEGNIKSTPRDLKNAKKITRKATKGKIQEKDIFPSVSADEIKKNAISGAKAGAAIGGVLTVLSSTYSNIKEVKNGKKDSKDAIKDVIKETVNGSVDGAIKGAASKASIVVGEELAKKTGSVALKKVCSSSAPAAVAIGGIECAKSVIKWTKGEISGKELRKEVANTAITTGTTYVGGEIGAAIGTAICPGIGTAIGAIVGSVAGSFIPSFFKK